MIDDNPFAVKTPTTALRPIDETLRGIDPLTGASVQGSPADSLEMPQEAPMPGMAIGVGGIIGTPIPSPQQIQRAPVVAQQAPFNPDAVQPPRYPQPTPVAPAPSAAQLAPQGQTVASNQIPSAELVKMTANYKWAMEQAALWENRCMNARGEAEKYRNAYHKELVKTQPDMQANVRHFEWEESPLDITIR